MASSNLRQPKLMKITESQEDNHLIYNRNNFKKINLFEINELKGDQKLNPRLLMIQKLKNQTQQLKQMKKTISTVSVSRLNQMKRIINQNLMSDSQSQYEFDRKPDFKKDEYKFNKSIKDLVQIKISEHKDNKESKSNEKIVVQDQNNNPQNPILNNCQNQEQQTNLIQSEHFNSKQSNQQPLQLITNTKQLRNFRFGHLRKISTQANHLETSQTLNKNTLIRAKSQRRQRSSSSQFSKLRNNDQMTLNVRKQLHLMQSKERILQNKIRLIQTQTYHKLDKKIKENTELLQKHKGLYDIIQSRMQRQRQRTSLTRKKFEQKRLVHQGKALKVSIQKLSKKKQKQVEKQIIRNQSEESLLNLTYKQFLKQKENLKKQENIAFMMSFSKDFPSKDLVASRMSYSTKSVSRVRSASTQYF